MNILIIGCGKLGAALSVSLDREGHDVSVIDPDEMEFDRLPDDFSGYTFTGVPIDQEVLRDAGIEACDACAAVTADDNINLMACQIATDIFHVPQVLARIYDPRRGSVFRQFGIHTVCPTNLSSAAILSMLTNHGEVVPFYFDSATADFSRITPEPSVVGKPLGSLCAANNETMGLFGVLSGDGRLLLASPASKRPVKADDTLLYVRVAD